LSLVEDKTPSQIKDERHEDRIKEFERLINVYTKKLDDIESPKTRRKLEETKKLLAEENEKHAQELVEREARRRKILEAGRKKLTYGQFVKDYKVDQGYVCSECGATIFGVYFDLHYVENHFAIESEKCVFSTFLSTHFYGYLFTDDLIRFFTNCDSLHSFSALRSPTIT
jgi:hypothetical protein